MSSTVSNPYSFNISKDTRFSSSNIVKSSTFECEFKITACEEFVLTSNEYGSTKMSGYFKDFSYDDLPEYVFDLGSVNITNISNGCSLLACYALMDMYMNDLYYSVYIKIKTPSIDGTNKSINMKTYIMDSNNNITEAETLPYSSYKDGITTFQIFVKDSMFNIYNTIVSSYKNPNRYIKLYIE